MDMLVFAVFAEHHLRFLEVLDIKPSIIDHKVHEAGDGTHIGHDHDDIFEQLELIESVLLDWIFDLNLKVAGSHEHGEDEVQCC